MQLGTSTVQIPSGVTLTIEPGVSVTMSGGGDYMFLIHGTIFAHGTSEKKIVLDGGMHCFFSSEAAPSNALVDLDNCIIKNGASLINFIKSFYLRHSEVINLVSASDISFGPTEDVYIEYNRFTNVSAFSCGGGSNVYIRYNLFDTKNHALGYTYPWIWNKCSPKTVVQYNSFINTDGIALMLQSMVGSEGMIATENYWGTQDTAVIDAMIYDKNDDIRLASCIDYLPILTAPCPDTPSLLRGDANGDGFINVLDITKVARIILGLDAATPGADANHDTVVNVGDMTQIVSIILGLT